MVLERGRPANPGSRICESVPNPEELELLRGLYLGDVRAADAKLGRLIERLRERGLAENLITVVTSDHGEHFGEHRLLEHAFSVREATLRVPLVVHGLPDVEPARIEQPVRLSQIAPSILRWTGAPLPAELSAPPLPLEPGEPVEPVGEPFFGFYSDRSIDAPNVDRALVRADKKSRRQFCGESDPVFGDMVALLDYPLKLIWYERYPPELYDLSWDPLEKSNLASQQPERVERLAAAAEAFARAAGLADFASSDAPELPAEAVEALRALGYAD